MVGDLLARVQWLEEAVRRIMAHFGIQAPPSNSTDGTDASRSYRIGERGELYTPTLDLIRRKAREKYPDGYIGHAGPDFSPGDPRNPIMRERVDVPVAVMWPGTITNFASMLNSEQIVNINMNHARYAFVMQQENYGLRFAPQAFAFRSVPGENRYEPSVELPNVWTVSIAHATLQDLDKALREFAKRRYEIEV